MDIALLTFFNQTLAHPWLDILMVGVTYGGLGLMPGLTMVLWLRGQRRLSLAMLVAFIATLMLTFVFQYLVARPRPAEVRLVLATPNFFSYPSGHAAGAFGVAMILGLTYRQWRWWSAVLTGATLIALSRVYLGVHYPSDVVAGAILGATVGAACYGFIVARGVNQSGWQWLLWPQIAVVILVTQMAYLDLIPRQFLRWPLIDKALHFLLFGSVVFWLNFWLGGRKVVFRQWFIPLAILIPLAFAGLEEGAQFFSPVRSPDVKDLLSDLIGMLFFWWLSNKIYLKSGQTHPMLGS